MSGPDGVIDLRSDTVTQPTAAMRRAMSSALVGDDVFGEDPTVRALEELVAGITGKEAALFVASGTMANLVAVLVHCPRGSEVIADERSHLVLNEAGAASFVAGVSVRTLRSGPDAQFERRELIAARRDPGNPHHPRSSLVMLEDTHAHRMGQPLPASYVDDVAAWAHGAGLAVHVDGARLFNAAIALGTDAAILLRAADSGSICLSKGLACPAGSLVVGSQGFIEEARRARKALGGGQRQVGILAAAGLVALEPGPDRMVERLAEDHALAARLAAGVAALPGVALDPRLVRTNIVIFRLTGDDETSATRRDRLLAELDASGIRLMAYPDGYIRAATHVGIKPSDIDVALAGLERALRNLGSA
jgi:threonine aldolase